MPDRAAFEINRLAAKYLTQGKPKSGYRVFFAFLDGFNLSLGNGLELILNQLLEVKRYAC